MSERLDIELVIRSLARSRSHAASLITQNRVLVNGKVASKPAQKIALEDHLAIGDGPDFVSRAGQKLSDALKHFEVKISGECLDAGASTGGFTQVLLESGADSVVCVDVGHDQLAKELLADSRVTNIEGCNLRQLNLKSLETLTGRSHEFRFVVADLSFISLTLVIPNLAEIAPQAQQIWLIKPQFEVGKHSLNASGIVTDWRDRYRAINQVVDCAIENGFSIQGLMESTIRGTHGNSEYLLWITPKAVDNRPEWSKEIERLAKREK